MNLRRRDGDDGLALVVALVIVLLVFLLISTALAQSLFDLSQSTLVRRRYEAMNAAEAGVAWYSQLLSTASATTITVDPWVKDGKGRYVAESPAGTALATGGGDDPATFTVEVIYLKTDPCPTSARSAKLLCSADGASPFTEWDTTLPDPIYAMVTSVGYAGPVTRALQVPIRLHPQRTTASAVGFAFGGFCLGSGSSVTISGQMTISGGSWPAAYADCPTAGVTVPTNTTLNTVGPVLTAGGFSATASGITVTASDLIHAGGAVGIGSGTATTNKNNWDKCGNKSVRLNGGAYGSAISVNSSGCVSTWSTTQGAPTIPVLQYATKFDAAEWSAAGFQVVAGAPPVDLSASARTVFNLAGCSGPLALTNASYTLKWDVAIFSQCGYTVSGAQFLGGGRLFLIVAAPACSGGADKTTVANVGAQQAVFISTPCVLDLRSTTGQLRAGITAGAFFVGGTVNLAFAGSSALGIPGPVSSFTQDVRYLRELTAQEVEALT